jgi:hypothetical protein
MGWRTIGARAAVWTALGAAWALVVPLLGGCLASNMTEYAKAIASDPANVCVAVSSPYGGGVIGRVNTPGAKLSTSGGQCTIETAPAR